MSQPVQALLRLMRHLCVNMPLSGAQTLKMNVVSIDTIFISFETNYFSQSTNEYLSWSHAI